MIAVVMERACKDTSEWAGMVGGKLGGKLYVDMSVDAQMDEAMDSLIQQLQRLGVQPHGGSRGNSGAKVEGGEVQLQRAHQPSSSL